MPIRSSVTGQAQAVPAGYPKLMQAPSGSVWLITGPSTNPKAKPGRSTGVIVHLGPRPQKERHQVGYVAPILSENDMRPFTGEVKLQA